MVAEATEASALDSLHDGVSSVDEGSTDGRQHRQGTLELLVLYYYYYLLLLSIRPHSSSPVGSVLACVHACKLRDNGL